MSTIQTQYTMKCNTNELRPFKISESAWKMSTASRVTESP